MSKTLKKLTLPDFLKKYPSIVQLSVKWGDMDDYLHVNNCSYIKYQETSRLRYFTQMLKYVDDTQFSKQQFIDGTGIGPILANTFCAYKYPVKFPDKLLLGATVAEEDMQSDRYTMRHAAWSLKHQRVVAEGFGTVVTFDYNANKPVATPPALRQAMQQLQATNSLHLQQKILESAQNLEDDF